MYKEQYGEMVQNVEDGRQDALEVFCILNDMIKYLTKCKSQIEGLALEEAAKFGGKTFNDGNYQITVKNGGQKAAYNHIPEWVEAKQRLDDIQEMAKDPAKVAHKGGFVIDEATGATILPAKFNPIKDSISVKTIIQ